MKVFTSCFLKRTRPFVAALVLALTPALAPAVEPADTEQIDLTFTSITRIKRTLDANDADAKQHLIFIGGTLDSGETAGVTYSACAACLSQLALMDDCLRAGKLAKILGDQGVHVYASLQDVTDGQADLAELQEDSDGDGEYDLTYSIEFDDASDQGYISCGLVDP